MPTNHSKNILVVGGAGFIGSHMALILQQAGYRPVVLDNLSKGYKDAVCTTDFFAGNMQDESLLDQLFSQYSFAAVMHFASYIEVGESVREPLKYYENNFSATVVLLKKMLEYGVHQFIFSSTAAVYGEPIYTPIDEQHPIGPINPYGHSKAMVEQVLQDLSKSHELRFAILRYFNAAGADPAGRLRERHEPETHLIPLLLQVARGDREAITVYGQDYPTHDGTCIRDYIHVTDLCTAHLAAVEYLAAGAKALIANLGSGTGHSVQEVIAVARQVTQREIKVLTGPRRPGDPAVLLANPNLAMRILNWQPRYSDLTTMVSHAWQGLSG